MLNNVFNIRVMQNYFVKWNGTGRFLTHGSYRVLFVQTEWYMYIATWVNPRQINRWVSPDPLRFSLNSHQTFPSVSDGKP